MWGMGPIHPAKAEMEINIDDIRDTNGDPLDEENREKVRQELAKGRANFESAPKFNRNRSCIKCGGTKVKSAYHNGRNYECFPHSGGREHILRICNHCGYTWHERCLSEEEYAP